MFESFKSSFAKFLTLLLLSLVELTSPSKENFNTRNLDKSKRYQDLCVDIKLNGSIPNLFLVEVGARGYCGQSLTSCLRRLGQSAKSANSAVKTLSLTAMKAFFEIGITRNSPILSKRESSSNNKTKSYIDNNNSTLPYRRSSCSITGLFNKDNTCYISTIKSIVLVVLKLLKFHYSAILC